MTEMLSGVGFMGNPSPARTCLPSLPETARSAKALTGARIKAEASKSMRMFISPFVIETSLSGRPPKRKGRPKPPFPYCVAKTAYEKE